MIRILNYDLTEEMKKGYSKGFYASIYDNKEFGNSSNDGISAKYDSVFVITDIPELQIYDYDPATQIRVPAVVIKKRWDYLYAKPVEPSPDDCTDYRMGGAFIYSSDSRFRELISKYPIPLHDRVELLQDFKK